MNNVDRMPAWVADVCFPVTALLTIASGVHYVFRASAAIARVSHGPPVADDGGGADRPARRRLTAGDASPSPASVRRVCSSSLLTAASSGRLDGGTRKR